MQINPRNIKINLSSVISAIPSFDSQPYATNAEHVQSLSALHSILSLSNFKFSAGGKDYILLLPIAETMRMKQNIVQLPFPPMPLQSNQPQSPP